MEDEPEEESRAPGLIELQYEAASPDSKAEETTPIAEQHHPQESENKVAVETTQEEILEEEWNQSTTQAQQDMSILGAGNDQDHEPMGID